MSFDFCADHVEVWWFIVVEYSIVVYGGIVFVWIGFTTDEVFGILNSYRGNGFGEDVI